MDRRGIPVIAFLLAARLAAASTAASEALTSGAQCLPMVEHFCDVVWDPAHRGNLDFAAGGYSYPIRLGQTPNDISQARYVFLTSLRDHFGDLPADIRSALERTYFRPLLEAYLHRKTPAKLELPDLVRPEFLRGVLSALDEAMTLVSWERVEKQHPGAMHLMADETSFEFERDEAKHLDTAWSDLFVATWRKHAAWAKVRETFELVRAEYRAWISENRLYSGSMKTEMLADLDSLKLVIPGENPAKSNSKKWHECGIDLNNSFYSPVDHELTVCVGDFAGVPTLLTIAHEVGHSFSLTRRLLDYWAHSAYGQSILGLWRRACADRHYSCSEWDAIKKNVASQSSAIPPYKYEDSAFLEKFVEKKLEPVPRGPDLDHLADRMVKSTVRSEMNSHFLEGMIKPEEILPAGHKVPNFMYLKPCLNASRWPRAESALDAPDLQFELFFTEEYACQLERKTPAPEALQKSVEEAQRLATLAWAALLRVPGRYSYLQDARDEEFAQDIEEDVVDAIAADITARILKKKPSLTERRGEFLASIAGYCEKPSFLQRYPEEALVLSRFTNLSHSEGLDRRKKLLTPEVRAALECR
jgi:hypothetical protein